MEKKEIPIEEEYNAIIKRISFLTLKVKKLTKEEKKEMQKLWDRKRFLLSTINSSNKKKWYD